MGQGDEWIEGFFTPGATDAEVAREKAKARELKQSQWWKRKRSSGRCHYCGRAVPPRELTLDHVVPLIRGGKTTRSNVVPCCRECNSAKKYLLPLEWEEHLRRLGGGNGGGVDEVDGVPDCS